VTRKRTTKPNGGPRRLNGIESFSEHFKISKTELAAKGAFDPILSQDARLSIDPKLLSRTSLPELRNADKHLKGYFESILLLLKASTAPGDALWRAAYDRFKFPEFQGSMLGYVAVGDEGSGWSTTLRTRTLQTVVEIVLAGTTNPRIFELAGVLEEGIGADRISDMIGTILTDQLCAYTLRVCTDLGIPVQQARVKTGAQKRLPTYLDNEGRKRYVILIPKEILASLPIALDRSGIADVVEHNRQLREYFNRQLGKEWRRLITRGSKRRLRDLLLSNPEALQQLLVEYEKAKAQPYNFDSDPQRKLLLDAARLAVSDSTAALSLKKRPRAKDILRVVNQIVDEFQRFTRGQLRKVLFRNGAAPSEATFQILFALVADTFCKARNLDLSVEVVAGSGRVDFKVSDGRLRIMVELKISRYRHLLDGFTEQLPDYIRNEEAAHGMYIVLDVGGTEDKVTALKELADQSDKNSHVTLRVIDAQKRPSPSRLRRSRAKKVKRSSNWGRGRRLR
jgi:hypothetical protein